MMRQNLSAGVGEAVMGFSGCNKSSVPAASRDTSV
jgi:hypothetical protein